MKRITNLFLFGFIFIQILDAQLYHDRISFYDGSTINGIVINDSADKYLVKDLKGDITAYSSSEILDVKRIKPRYISYTAAGLIYGSALNEKPVALSVMSEHNIQFLNYFGLGGVIGTELVNELVIPVGVNAKVYLPLHNRIWFLNTSYGYSYSAEDPQTYYEEYKGSGGIFVMAELGMLIPLNYHNSLFVTLGYRYNELNYTYEEWWRGTVHRTYYYNRILLRFGISLY